ncbi:hypothetical protein FQN51_005670 [Onygenales sp. PD_10]|nr:hypothetical protein FQN51_005670 [Onygenales sp. PD_10]
MLQSADRMWALFIFCCLARLAFAGTTSDWKSRSIYQVFTDRFARTDGSTSAKCDTKKGLLCGGTWRGIINHLDYIQGMGFDAIMISPVTENIEGRVEYGEAYHGYWPQDLYKLNPHFGSRTDLLDLQKQLHDRGMYFMVDVVINNMASMTNGSDPSTAVDYSILKPFNDKKYFHSYCKIEDYDDYDEAQKCWTGDDIVALADLNTEDDTVTKMMEDWVKGLVSNYSIDGLRIDAAKHVGTDYLAKIANAAGVFTTGEVYDGDVHNVCGYQNYIPSVPNYPVYFAMIKAFTAGNTTALSSEISFLDEVCKDVSALATFSENHDLPRFPSYTKDLSLAKNVLTFTILSDGIPLYYQGQEQHFSGSGTPTNREALWTSKYSTTSPLYTLTASLNKIRSHAIRLNADYLSTTSYPVYTDGSTIAVRKGVEGRQVLTIYSTQGVKGGEYMLELPVSYTPGMQVVEVLGCRNYTVEGVGVLRVQMGKGLPKVFFPEEKMEGSGLCGFANATEIVGGVVQGGAGGLRTMGVGRVVMTVMTVMGVVVVGVFVGGW